MVHKTAKNCNLQFSRMLDQLVVLICAVWVLLSAHTGAQVLKTFFDTCTAQN